MLFNLNLELRPGQVTLVTGDSGCGLSTMLHLMHMDFAVSGGSLQFHTAAGWLPFHPTSTDRYDMQQRMGFCSPQACAVFFASVQASSS